MKYLWIMFLTGIILHAALYWTSTRGCSFQSFKTCGCLTVKRTTGKRLYCRSINVSNFLSSAVLPNDVVWIDFSDNHEQELSNGTFGTRKDNLRNFQRITKLDFSSNGIWKISPGTFSVFPNLTRLDLSHNSIGNLTAGMFDGLLRLKHLDLSFNEFPIIPGNAFKSLRQLKKIDLRSTNLVCNCLMRDFVVWLRNPTTPKAIGTCHLPKAGLKLQNLNPRKLGCGSQNPLSRLPYFEISPMKPQLLFEGDSMRIQCEGTNLPNSQLYWSFNNANLSNGSKSLHSNTSVNHYRSIITGWMIIGNVTSNHSGDWKCTVISPHGNVTKSIKLAVVGRNAQYCRKNEVANHHGDFTWPSSVEGLSKRLVCQQHSGAVYSNIQFATRFCGRHGWHVGNYMNCPFKDKVTNEIHKYILKDPNLFKNREDMLENLMHKISRLPVREQLTLDFLSVLMSETWQRLSYDTVSGDITDWPLLNLAGYLMKTDASMLQTAQTKSNLCREMLDLIERYILRMITTGVIHAESENIAVGGMKVSEKPQLTAAMTCIVTDNGIMKAVCGMPSFGRYVSASSFRIPVTALDNCKGTNENYKIYFVVYRNASLFLQGKSVGNMSTNDAVATEMVFQMGIEGCSSKNLSNPVVFNIATKKCGNRYPAVWTKNGWVRDKSCTAHCMSQNYTQVVCHKLVTVTLVYASEYESCGLDNCAYEFSHPAVITGTLVLAVCLLVVIITYLACADKLMISKESRHMVLNICFHLLVATCLFAFCIRLVSRKGVCLISGFSLHYASLTVLFWITLSVRSILRQLLALTKPPSLEPKPRKPILRYYLIGCGMPLVICGITAAVKGHDYCKPGDKYCWLPWEASVYAFYLPATAIALFCIFFLLRVLCIFNRQSRHFDSNRSPLAQNSSRGQHYGNNRYQAIFTNEPCNCSEIVGHNRADSPVAHHHALCRARMTEQSFKGALTGTAVLFVLYLFSWVSAAVSIAAPDMRSNQFCANMEEACYYFDMKEDGRLTKLLIVNVFSWLYAIFVIAIGLCVLLQSLVLRKSFKSRCKKLFNRRISKDIGTGNDGSVSSFSKCGNADDPNLDYLTSTNDKSLRTGGKRGRAYPTIKTDPTSETMLPSTESAGNNVDSYGRSHHVNGDDFDPCLIHHGIRDSATSLHRSSRAKQYSRNESMSRIMDSATHSQYPHQQYPHEGCRVKPRGYHPDSLPYHHMSFHNHCVSHRHDHGKPAKMTNLRNAHESSMTEHSLDDLAFNNMHTIPVIMQHHAQAKINNSALVDRYQKVRKALERKRARQRKLNVLREYAHDPLTSNDEVRNEKQPGDSLDEASPLMASVEKRNDIQPDGSRTYRPLLISPRHKKQEKSVKNRSGSHSKRVKRLGTTNQPRPVVTDKGRKTRGNRSSVSEREQDTASSSNGGGVRNEVQKSPSSTKLEDSHGYLTLEQFQNVNTFLFPNWTESKSEGANGTM